MKIFLLNAVQPKFLVVGILPVLVGSAVGFSCSGTFDWLLFLLSLIAMAFIHAGSNLNNDYFDHLSRADWENSNPTEFSGGSRFIQDGLLSPKAIILMSLVLYCFGAAVGVVICLITQSVFILSLGIVGVLGGFFYTAKPVQLCYRGLGEISIACLFGILPVCGAYWLQCDNVDPTVIWPAIIMSGHVFLIILINEFPDFDPDTKVGKKTLLVKIAPSKCLVIYKLVAVSCYVTAVVGMIFCASGFLFSGLLYLATAPVMVRLLKKIEVEKLLKAEDVSSNRLTIMLHSLAAISLVAGFLIEGLV